MGWKRALLLILILALISYSRSTPDVLHGIPELADDLLRVFSENTESEKIRARVGELKEKHYPLLRAYEFYGHENFSLRVFIFFKIKRGIPYELQEKMIFDSLIELFGNPPKSEPLYVRRREYYPITLFREYHAWYARRNFGARCRFALGIRRGGGAYNYFNKIPHLWLKLGSIDITFDVEHAPE